MKIRIFIILFISIIFNISPVISADDSLKTNNKSPRKAMLFSLLLPGGGQFYNGSYIKGGIIAGLESYLIGMAIYERNQANDSFNKHELYANQGNSVYSNYYYNEYLIHYENEQNFIWWTLGTILYSIGDAYVDAHLQGFDKEFEDSPKISFSAGIKYVNMKIRF